MFYNQSRNEVVLNGSGKEARKEGSIQFKG